MFCKNCGNKIPDESKFCEECGVQINLDTPDKVEDVEEDDILLSWAAKIRIVTDKTIWKQLLFCFAIAGIFIVLILNIALINQGDWGIKVLLWSLLPVAGVIGILLILALPSMLMIGFYEPSYTLTTDGIICTFVGEALKSTKRKIGALKAIGITTGNMTMTANAFMAGSKLYSDMKWKNVINVAYREDKNMIIVQQKGFSPNRHIWIYCHNNFDEVKSIIEANVGKVGNKVPKIAQ